MTTMRFILAAPPSANRMYRAVNGKVLKSKQYRDWAAKAKIDVSNRLVQCYPPHKRQQDPAEDRFSVEIFYYPKDNRKRDIDNLIKPLLDVLEGRAFDNDNQVDRVSVTRLKVNKGLEEATVELYVSAL